MLVILQSLAGFVASGTCRPSSLNQDSNTALSLRGSCKKHDIGQINYTKNMNILLVYELTSACEFQYTKNK